MKAAEPTIEELKKIQVELLTSPSTDENMQKLEAINSQIKRREKNVTKDNSKQSA